MRVYEYYWGILGGPLETQESKPLHFFLKKMTKGLVNQSYGGLKLQVQLALQLWKSLNRKGGVVRLCHFLS